MPYYGHRCATVPQRHRDAWWVCTACMPDFVPKCGLCSAVAPIVDRQPGFVGHAYGHLCPACVARVKQAGPWRERRARAAEARRDALRARFPGLAVVRAAPAVIQLAGEIDGRRVEVRLRLTTRQDCNDRHVFHVQHDVGTLDAASLELPEGLRSKLARGSPTYTQTAVRWLRVAFAHLGKLDTVVALEHLLARTRPPAS
ncbi:hypothetical protein [Nannocystis exedens]|uniref:hypothetical protein n=1 Tax=Nannocystis exedens TaxID=54 RepID=UPI00117D1540|nr:hypothetical protein [Nannocystis exedens]